MLVRLAALGVAIAPAAAHANLSHLGGGWSVGVFVVVTVLPPALLLPLLPKGRRLRPWAVIQAVWMALFGLYVFMEARDFAHRTRAVLPASASAAQPRQ